MVEIAWRCVSVRMEHHAISSLDSVTAPLATWDKTVAFVSF